MQLIPELKAIETSLGSLIQKVKNRTTDKTDYEKKALKYFLRFLVVTKRIISGTVLAVESFFVVPDDSQISLLLMAPAEKRKIYRWDGVELDNWTY
jgi:oligoribonuclease (3'-5' exoribonuclease)